MFESTAIIGYLFNSREKGNFSREGRRVHIPGHSRFKKHIQSNPINHLFLVKLEAVNK
jgi:hypothetical protein